jgi:hypothetical protein
MPISGTTSHSSGARLVRRTVEPVRSDIAQSSRAWQSLRAYAVRHRPKLRAWQSLRAYALKRASLDPRKSGAPPYPPRARLAPLPVP